MQAGAERWQHQGWKRQEETLLQGLVRACSLPDALVSAQRYELWTFGLQNCEKINLLFQSPTLQQFVTEDIGN